MLSTIPLPPLVIAVLTRVPAAIACTIAYIFLRNYEETHPRATRWAKLGFLLGGVPIVIYPLFLALEFELVQGAHGSGIPLRPFVHYAYNLFQSAFWAALHTFTFYCFYKSIRVFLESRDA